MLASDAVNVRRSASFDAITIENNVAYVDFNKCRMCTKCVDECPTGALVKVNFPVKKRRNNHEFENF